MKRDSNELERDVRQLMLELRQMKDYCDSPLIMERGEGIYCFDVDGNRYIEGVSGIYVTNIGHGNRHVIDAIRQQLCRSVRQLELVCRRSAFDPRGQLSPFDRPDLHQRTAGINRLDPAAARSRRVKLGRDDQNQTVRVRMACEALQHLASCVAGPR